ncbi:MAG: glycosyltransferase family 2 protein [Chryseobacterium sp.]|uniref:glycosyltransferase family A protein n=1 Tax=Chryseobacterium sp. TaxID=1871047 RepID=UPI0025B94FC4|nr:glycosyltransferase family 2 protein [Chryseobacterium sp.]MCJ7933011.1 glycosyltransferase family 2 protein [Chryseobacterium sp.]
MNKITIFTPTYNRRNTLFKLYESLLEQSYQDFEWLIVDDGSTDNTDDLVDLWKSENKILIRYYKQENGGKHRAINKGLDYAEGELFFIVDSDDYLPSDSLEIINKHYSTIKGNDSFIGVVGYMATPNRNILGSKLLPVDILDSNLIERREKFGIVADMAKVLVTEKFREFYFPEINGEKFVAESLIWNRMALKYKFRYFNETIYIAEYMEGGLSNNSIRNRRKNPQYATLLYKELSHSQQSSMNLKLKSMINYWRFGFCKDKNILRLMRELGAEPLSLITLPFGLGLYIKDSFSDDINIKKLNNDG